MKRSTWFYRNGLGFTLLLAMLLLWAGQIFMGWKEHNEDRKEFSKPPLTINEYLSSGHFASATFENWESEFLQMAVYVLLTIKLRQKGSSESKKLIGEEGAGEEEVDREPVPSASAPWPVRKGGVWLWIYKNSLSFAFAILFFLSFWLHFKGSLREFNDEQLLKNKLPVSAGDYISGSRFWFESFQNWQSEFLAVASIVILSIWLRQKGSPESKPVDSPYGATGK